MASTSSEDRRPRGRRPNKSAPIDYRSELMALAREKMLVKENGRSVRRPILELIFRGILDDAIRGDSRMRKLYLKYLRYRDGVLRLKRREEACAIKPFTFTEEHERLGRELDGFEAAYRLADEAGTS
jgi:hypothetical protein